MSNSSTISIGVSSTSTSTSTSTATPPVSYHDIDNSVLSVAGNEIKSEPTQGEKDASARKVYDPETVRIYLFASGFQTCHTSLHSAPMYVFE
jgi:hypothetical protein